VTSIDELLERYNINELDILHCDVDGTESYVLDGAEKSLNQKKINTLFVMTHAESNSEEEALCRCGRGATKLHLEVRTRLLNYGYNLIVDHERCDIASDSMLIFKR